MGWIIKEVQCPFHARESCASFARVLNVNYSARFDFKNKSLNDFVTVPKVFNNVGHHQSVKKRICQWI